jgi:hypothetical protein
MVFPVKQRTGIIVAPFERSGRTVNDNGRLIHLGVHQQHWQFLHYDDNWWRLLTVHGYSWLIDMPSNYAQSMPSLMQDKRRQ